MRRTRAAVAVLVGAVLTIGVVVGATGASADAPHASSSKTITVWSWFVQSTMQKAINAYEKTHPGVTIKYTYYNYSPQYLTALKTAAASNTLPDIIGLQPGSLTQQYRSKLEPIQKLASQTWGSNWTSKIYPVDLKQMQLGNPAGNHNYYMVPQESQVLTTWYNIAAFKKLKLSVPRTLAQLVRDSQVLTSNGYLPMYQGAAGAWQNENMFLTIANQLSPGVTNRAQDGQVSWASAPLVRAMTTWGELFKNGVFQSGALGAEAYPTGAQLFASGKVGMMYLGSWWLQEAQLAPPVPTLVQGMKGFGWFNFPSVTGSTKPGAIVGGIDVGLGLTTTGAADPQSWDFLSSLVDGSAAKAALVDVNDLAAFKGISPPTSVAPRVRQLYKELSAELPKAQNQRFASPVVQNAFDNALAAVASGQKSPSAALAIVESAQKLAHK